MKRYLFAIVLSAAAGPLLAADVAVSLSVGQPGFYGRLDLGDYPPPQVIYQQPMMIQRGPMDRPPVYLHVPPGHAKNWRKHCRDYNACGERVFFVQNNWYNREYVPTFQERQRHRQDGRADDFRDERREVRREDPRNEHQGDNRGRNRN